MANIFNIEQYKPKKKDEFFFDANIWIYILIPALSHDQILEQKYSHFWGEIRSQNAKVLTSFIVISEFVNRYLRFNLDKYNKENSSNIKYKTFKNKPEYKKSYNYIISLVKQVILPNCQLVSDPLEIIEDNSSIYNYSEKCDLNDNYIIALSKYYECFLVSQDRYLANCTTSINILSA